jgi:putative spermidine/putrescine transport system ATP-binding protein
LLLPVAPAVDERKDATVFALRPERITLGPGADDGIEGTVHAVTYLGPQTEYHVRVGEAPFVVIRPTPGTEERLASVKPGDIVSLTWDRQAPRLVPLVSSEERSS